MGGRFDLTDAETGDESSGGIGRRTFVGTTLAGLAGVGATATPIGAQELSRELVIESRTDRVEYRFTVSGDVEFGEEAGDGDEITDGTVTGVITGIGRDDYYFSRNVTAFEITRGADQAVVRVDGSEVDPEDLGGGDGVEVPEYPHELTLEAVSEEVEYSVVLDGKFDPDGASGEAGEFEEDGTVVGELAEGETATYGYFGPVVTAEVTEGVLGLSVERGTPRATVRGEESAEDPLPHRVLFFGLGEDASQYRFSAEEEVTFGEAAEEADTELPADRQVDENTVEGYVHAHDGDPLADDFYFDGEPEVEQAEGPIRVKLKW